MGKLRGTLQAMVQALGLCASNQALTEERAAYAEIGRIVAIPFSTPNVYERFADQVGKIIPFDMVVITQLDVETDSFEIKHTFGMDLIGIRPGTKLNLKGSVIEKVAQANQAIRTDLYVHSGIVAKSLSEAGLLSRIGTPLIANDQVVGTLHVTSKVLDAYGKPELARLEIVGNQIAGALASAIQLQAEKDRAKQLKSLYEVAAILAQPLSFEEKAQRIVDELASITEADYVILRQADREQKYLNLVAVSGSGVMDFEPSLDLSESNLSTKNAYLNGQPILNNDYQRSLDARVALLNQGVESMYFMPIKSGEQAYGSLSVASKTINYFDEGRVALVTAFSNEIGSLLRLAEQSTNLQDSKDELEAQNQELTRLNQVLESHYMISQIFSKKGDFKEKAKSALEMLVLLTGADWATFRLPDDSKPGLHLAAAAGPTVLQSPPPQVATESESFSTAAFMENRTIVIDDYAACASASPVVIAMGVKSLVFVPVQSGDKTLGLVSVVSTTKNAFNDEMVDLFSSVVERFGVVAENALLHDESERSQENLQVLAEALANSNRQIHDSNMMLEERVKIRTQELDTARERAMRSEKLAMIGQLSGGIAHDLRNPLGAIKNAAYLTKRKFKGELTADNTEKITDLLELIDGEVIRAEDVISNLLSYGSNREIAFSKIDTKAVIHDSMTGFVLQDNMELSTKIEPGMPQILGDSSQLIRALQNLMVNAQDAMREGELNGGCLSVKAFTNGDSVEIVIADNGTGISPENLGNIFEPLYTAKSRGTGLGLAICQEIINKHNGTISVESEIGVGTSFSILIPFAVKENSEIGEIISV